MNGILKKKLYGIVIKHNLVGYLKTFHLNSLSDPGLKLTGMEVNSV
jgi:hypothetical protein